MKRWIIITCAFLLFFAGPALAWTRCERVSFASHGNHHSSETASHSHDHHSDGDLPMFHCPNLFSEFVLSSVILPTDQKVKLDKFYVAPCIAKAEIAQFKRYNSFDTPPGIVLASVPDYLMLSVLRI